MELIQSIDLSILLFIQERLRFDWMTPFWKGITFLGNGGWFWIAAALVLLIPKKTRWAGVCGLLSMGLGFLISNLLLKNLIARVRPYEVEQALHILIQAPTDWSFPSGHTTASFACALAFFRTLPRRYGVAALILAGLIAWSRLYVGVHYPTDILGGLLVAAVSSWAVCRAVRAAREKRERKRLS